MEDSAVDASDRGRLPLGSLPVLVYSHGTGSNKRQTAFCVADQSICSQVVPELTENNFHATQHGWVFLHEPESMRTRLWDPRSGETVALPDMERDLPAKSKCYLSDVPTAPSCVVLVLCASQPTLLYCHVRDDDDDGNNRWTEHEYDVGTVPLPPEYAPPTKWVIRQTAAVGGRFYFLETGQLGVLEFLSDQPGFTFHDYPHPAFPTGSNAASSYLVASRDELFDVRIFLKSFSPEVLTVHVYKVDLSSDPTLCRVDDLGDRVLLLSYPNAQLLCSASRYGLKRNHVYFMHNVMKERDGGLLHIYDMNHQSLDTMRPCQDMTELMNNPFWILPTDSDCN